MQKPERGPTRCAFIVLRVKRRGEPYLLLVRDERWGDLTLIGGHEEPSDEKDLDKTARREAFEELGSVCSGAKLKLFPLTNEILLGPTWSKSATIYKNYNFKFYGAKFGEQPDLKEGRNEAGLWLTLVKQNSLGAESNLSNVVKLLLDSFKDRMHQIPLSWDYDCPPSDFKENSTRTLRGICEAEYGSSD